jgi:hypothetical protein
MNDAPAQGFDAGWLALREPFDAAARDGRLTARFVDTVAARAARRQATDGSVPQACRLVDLAAGTGANVRLLAPLVGGRQDWLLVDHDPALIAAQPRSLAAWAAGHGWPARAEGDALVIDAPAGPWRIRSVALDLQRSLDRLDLDGIDGVTTTAFLDLVSDDWLERFCDRIVAAGVPLLATLTVDGRRDWHPPSPDDESLTVAFERHQQGDKGFGPSLGPGAVDALVVRLQARGYRTQCALADWQVDGASPAMLLRMVEECAAVAREADPDRAPLFDRWEALRRAQAQSGSLRLCVGHRDLLALPARDD